MKSTIQQRNIQPVTVISDTVISKQTISNTYYPRDDDFEQENVSFYGIICVYIFLVIPIMIGGGGIAVCVIYLNSEENTQNWEIGDIIIGVITCIITVILMIFTIFKQPWRKDILLHHSENYFNDDNNDLVYCNRLHSNTEQSLKSKRIPHTLLILKRAARRDSNGLRKREIFLKKNKSHDRLINYSLSHETQTDVSGHTRDNLILRRMCITTKQVLAKQPTTQIMIVRVPKVPGELILQPKKH